jgi:hypothetical protein
LQVPERTALEQRLLGMITIESRRRIHLRRYAQLWTYKTGPRYTCLIGSKKLILNLFLTDPLTRLRRQTGRRKRRLRATLSPKGARGRGVRRS